MNFLASKAAISIQQKTASVLLENASVEMPASVGHRAKGRCAPFVMEHSAVAEQIASAPKEHAPVVPPVSGPGVR